MADLFISYARADAIAARRAAANLRGAGLSVWFDEALPAHRAYADVIAEQLDGAAAVLVLWSGSAAASQWVRSEANRARESGRLVQARLDDCALPMPFDQIQCADLRRWNGDPAHPGWHAAAESIAELTGHERVAASPMPAPSTALSRRRALAIGGGAAIAAAGAGWLGWRALGPPPLSPEAQLLLQKGTDALQANDALDPQDEGSTAQAIALLTEATRAAPRSALAWGALALAYASRHRTAPLEQRAGLEVRGLAAARTALALDDREPRALAAAQIMAPLYRHWRQAEADSRRALDKNPRFPILLFVLSDILGNVGRWREATELSNRLDRSKFLLPGAERKAIVNLWSAGMLQAADEALAVAAERWPKHGQIWRTRLAYLLYSGRADQALAVLRDPDQLPPEIAPGLVAAATATARGLLGQLPTAAAIDANLAYARANPSAALPVAQAVTALGGGPTALQMLAGYYFGEGGWASLAPPGGDSSRTTSALFQPPMRPLWPTREFGTLLRRIGLDEYWRANGTAPDFRRAG